jgi:ferric-dicitrate binding protein FerR (iron transport regulator)
MENKLNEYFLGILPESEKECLFAELENNATLRERFIKLQNNCSLVDLLPVAKDDIRVAEGLTALRELRRRRALRGSYIRFARYAAAILLVAAVGAGIVRYSAVSRKIEYAEATAPTGKRMELTLPDGTKVWLAPRSKLVWPVEFSGTARSVELMGEALFDVVSDAQNPFEVKSGNFSVRAVGTMFDTSSYENSFETTLVEGIVEVYETSRPEEKITMSPNHRVCLNEGRLEYTEADPAEALGLQRGVYQFHDISFGDIVAKLATWYGVEVEILDPELKNEQFSAKFREADDIKTILKALQKTSGFDLRFDESGKIVIN